MPTFNEGTIPRTARSASILIALLLIGASVPAATLVASSGASAALNSVQVTIQTTEDLPYQYSLAAYNTSGYQVASFYGSYPEAGFGLPSGTYLITASAYYQQYDVCYLCPLEVGVNSSATSVAIPVRYYPPASEYGFAVVKVIGQSQIAIDTKNSTDFPLVRVPIHVAYFNGTAAVGASVSAYVVGMQYAYAQNWMSYGQTGSDGNVTLAMPAAPLEVEAHLSVPVQLPKGVGTVPVEVGGQQVNVTVYWQPAQVELSGQALILPPQSGADITLKAQQYPYSMPYPVYSGTGPAQSGVTTVTTTSTSAGPSQQGAAPSQPGRIAPFTPTSAQLSSPAQAAAGPASDPLVVLPLALAAGAAAAVALIAAMIGRRKQAVQSARP
ncbi:MAG: hypothetical protein JRN06_09885 [Nitrososphaerota archaeon]|nr:hypothetical protein [Nitrososphaerota archaeon]MDG7024896.1 hypothetical protein [Nitrososphaerota archaeon]